MQVGTRVFAPVIGSLQSALLKRSQKTHAQGARRRGRQSHITGMTADDPVSGIAEVGDCKARRSASPGRLGTRLNAPPTPPLAAAPETIALAPRNTSTVCRLARAKKPSLLASPGRPSYRMASLSTPKPRNICFKHTAAAGPLNPPAAPRVPPDNIPANISAQ